MTEKHPGRSRGGRIALTLIGLVVAGGTVGGAAWLAHARGSQTELARSALAAEAALGPRVEMVAVRQGPLVREINLLGDARPWVSANLFAKVSGYIKAVNVDKGERVTAGQVLAEIDSAETDSQWASAVADMQNKQKLVVRARNLLASGNVAPQAAEAAETALRMAEEAVRNLAAMRSYEKLRAPFDGTITARFADPGALLQAATTNQASSLPVLAVSDTSRLRIGIYIEQRDIGAVHVGDTAVVADAANPERQVEAKLSRTAGTLDPRTRTLYAEIDVDNRDGFLLPGAFANVTLKVPLKSLPQIPVTALLQRGGVNQVVMADANGAARFRPIRIGSTDGLVVSVAEGVAEGDRVAINVPNDVTEGVRMRLADAR